MLVDLNEVMLDMVSKGVDKADAFDYMMTAKPADVPTVFDKVVDNLAAAQRKLAKHNVGLAERKLARAKLRATQATE